MRWEQIRWDNQDPMTWDKMRQDRIKWEYEMKWYEMEQDGMIRDKKD